MQRFLCMRLYGPMVAWGDIAIGDRRPAAVFPSRSGVLGLVAGALGIQREDADRLAALDRGLGFASCVERRGELLVDYHTAQAPDGPTVRRALKTVGAIHTRRQELEIKDGGNAMISQRQYHTDALALACLWSTDAAVATLGLEVIAKALGEPVFVPYLGRKSCPMGLPLQPTLLDAANPVAAMRQVRFSVDDLLSRERADVEPRTYRWEGTWPGLDPDQTVRRRDQLHSRARWQFAERQEHVMQERSEHVPQPT